MLLYRIPPLPDGSGLAPPQYDHATSLCLLPLRHSYPCTPMGRSPLCGSLRTLIPPEANDPFSVPRTIDEIDFFLLLTPSLHQTSSATFPFPWKALLVIPEASVRQQKGTFFLEGVCPKLLSLPVLFIPKVRIPPLSSPVKKALR